MVPEKCEGAEECGLTNGERKKGGSKNWDAKNGGMSIRKIWSGEESGSDEMRTGRMVAIIEWKR